MKILYTELCWILLPPARHSGATAAAAPARWFRLVPSGLPLHHSAHLQPGKRPKFKLPPMVSMDGVLLSHHRPLEKPLAGDCPWLSVSASGLCRGIVKCTWAMVYLPAPHAGSTHQTTPSQRQNLPILVLTGVMAFLPLLGQAKTVPPAPTSHHTPRGALDDLLKPQHALLPSTQKL